LAHENKILKKVYQDYNKEKIRLISQTKFFKGGKSRIFKLKNSKETKKWR